MSFRVVFEFDISLRSNFSLMFEYNLIDLVVEIDLHQVVKFSLIDLVLEFSLINLDSEIRLQSPSNERDPSDVVSDIIFCVYFLLR